MKKFNLLLILVLFVGFLSCTTNNKTTKSFQYRMSVSVGKRLDVVLHQDKSDPVVAVAIIYHVGSNREVPGKTGFAHLFEHMMFQQSENVGQMSFFKKFRAPAEHSMRTGNDQTIYYEVVPKNALEMVFGWNRTGWVFLKTP
jgi:zinc protease